MWQSAQGNAVFGGVGATGQILVLASGVVTAIPLLCFGAAARRLPLSTLGFLQYVAPSMQLALAVWWNGEAFTVDHAISFGFIWAGLALFSAESILVRRRVADEALAPTPVRVARQFSGRQVVGVHRKPTAEVARPPGLHHTPELREHG